MGFDTKTIKSLIVRLSAERPKGIMPSLNSDLLDIESLDDSAAAAFSALPQDAQVLHALWRLGPYSPEDYRNLGPTMPFCLGSGVYTDGWARATSAACLSTVSKKWLFIKDTMLDPNKIGRTRSSLISLQKAAPPGTEIYVRLDIILKLIDFLQVQHASGMSEAMSADVVGAIQYMALQNKSVLEDLSQKLSIFYLAQRYKKHATLGIARNAVAFEIDSENFKPKSPADFLGTDMEQAKKLADLARRKLCQLIESRRAYYASLHLEEAALETALPAAAQLLNCSLV